MSREQYQGCMTQNLRGMPKGIDKNERKLLFCEFSKICSGKAKDKAEALKICSQPKEPKPLKAGAGKGQGKSCEKEVLELSQCMVENIDMSLASNINSIGTAIANSMLRCKCPNP